MWTLKGCPGRGANLGSFGFRLCSFPKAAPKTSWLGHLDRFLNN